MSAAAAAADHGRSGPVERDIEQTYEPNKWAKVRVGTTTQYFRLTSPN